MGYAPESVDLGALGNSLATELTLSPTGVARVTGPVTTSMNATKWTVTIAPVTGLFSGSFSLQDLVSSLVPALSKAATPEPASLEIQLRVPSK